MIYWCIKHEYFFSKSLILTFVRKNRVTQIRLYGLESSSRIPCSCANYRTTDEEQFISLIFLASFMAITLTLFFFFSLCCPGNNNTSSVESNIFAKNVDVFLPFQLQSECQIYLWKEKYKCGLWLLATKSILYQCSDSS